MRRNFLQNPELRVRELRVRTVYDCLICQHCFLLKEISSHLYFSRNVW